MERRRAFARRCIYGLLARSVFGDYRRRVGVYLHLSVHVEAGWRPLTVLSDIIKVSMNERGTRVVRVPLFGLL